MAESETEFKFGTWYPIESAPKDGTPFKAVRTTKQRLERLQDAQQLRWDTEWDRGWLQLVNDTWCPALFEPKFWMPLPPNPTDQH